MGSQEARRERAGSCALSIFARVLSADVLRVHADGPLPPHELRGRFGWAPEASVRVATANLCELGALERNGEGAGATALTEAGRDLLGVADALERWLGGSPYGSLELSGEAARGTVRALVGAWDATIVRGLAERPRRLAELSEQVSGYSYPTLKRRFAKLRATALVTPLDGGARSPKLEATPWLRRFTAPLSHAARWEQDHLPGATPLDAADLEAALLLAMPLVELAPEVTGTCVLAAPAVGSGAGAEQPEFAAVSLVVEEGKPASLSAGATSRPTTWVLGSADAWLDAVIEGQLDGLRIRGADADMAASLVSQLHKALL